MTHRVIVSGDTTSCSICGKSWDSKDPNPPKCRKSKKAKGRQGNSISIQSNSFNGSGRYTFADLNSDWRYNVHAPNRSVAERDARKAYRQDKQTNFGQIEITGKS